MGEAESLRHGVHGERRETLGGGNADGRLHDVPHQPGVYLMRDRLGKIIYVGKAKNLRKRLSNYFQPARSRMADLKTRSLIKSIWDFEFHVVRNEPESLLLECKLIKEYRPKYNISLRDDKRFLLLKMHPAEPWPRFFLTRTRKDDGARYFGPFAHSGSLRTTLHWMQHQFGLRSCRPVEPGETDYKHCHNDIIKNCCAPCIGRISQTDYLKKIDKACAFLEGRFKDHLKEIEAEMMLAAEELDFERAGNLATFEDRVVHARLGVARGAQGHGRGARVGPRRAQGRRGQRRHVLPDRIVRRVVDRGIEDGARRRVDDLGLELGKAFVAEAVGRGIEAADDEGVAGRFEREHLGVAERLGDDREAGKEIGEHGEREGADRWDQLSDVRRS